jgi:hypothetical protein
LHDDLGRLRVIGAGFGRTGTTSLKAALERLGYGPCYHMQTAMTRPGHAQFWRRARRGQVAPGRFLRGYRSAIDWPACEFYRELMHEFPDARVILTTRAAGPWYDSVRGTLWEIDEALPWWFPPSIRRMHDELIWQARFGGRFLERDHAIEVYEAHLDEVRRSVPAERLLVFDVAQGWEPQCRFLGRPVPAGEPFPRLNDRRYFTRIVTALRLARWAVPLIATAALAALFLLAR